MKNYLVGFGVIMAVGLAFALSGSNMASNMLATVLDVATLDTTTTNTAITTTITTDSAPVGWISGIATTTTTTTATTSDPIGIQALSAASATVRTAFLSGLTNGQILQGVQVLSVYANDGPISARFVITNAQTNASSIIEATCVVGTATYESSSKCVAEIGTALMANGKYTITAHVLYGDKVTVASDQVSVYVYNAAPKFTFTPIVGAVSGTTLIEGTISAATAVEFLYSVPGSTQTFRIGNGIYSGGVTVSKWTYKWDTKLIPNGYYTVIANVTSRYNNGVAYRAGEMRIGVFNETPVVAPTIEPVVVVPTTTPTVIPRTIIPTPEPVVIEPTKVLTPEELAESMSTNEQVSPITKPTEELTVKPSSEPTTGFGMTAPEPIGTQSRPIENEQNIGTQNNVQPQAVQTPSIAAPVIPVPPVVQRIQDIAIGLQSGNDVVEVNRKVVALQKELWGDVNPASPAVQAKMQYQSAKQFGTTVNTSVMRVAEIALATTTEEVVVSVATTTAKGVKTTIKEKRKVIKEKVRLAGKALPNMYVTLYIYSEVPTIAVVKADRNGNWVYELDSKLADGRHEAYVTINDRTGKVVAKSTLFGFVKTAEAITPENTGLANIAGLTDQPIQPVEAAKKTYGLVVFMIIGGGLLVGILLVIRSFRSKRQDLI